MVLVCVQCMCRVEVQMCRDWWICVYLGETVDVMQIPYCISHI